MKVGFIVDTVVEEDVEIAEEYRTVDEVFVKVGFVVNNVVEKAVEIAEE